MKLFNTSEAIILENQNQYYKLQDNNWDELINTKNLAQYLTDSIAKSVEFDSFDINSAIAPIVSQEVWASGVTYLRSKTARMEESKDSGGGDFYDRVYDAERPEIFFKATAYRTVGPGEKIRIRKDSKWNVPEPELTLFINKYGEHVGYTVGNDVSSRDIEGENPLYLPQAKSYDKSAAIGPCISIIEGGISLDSKIKLEIFRDNKLVFSQSTDLNQMKRKQHELVHYLTLELSFQHGVFLMTGTGIVPPDEFSLISNDRVEISIDNIGTLINTVE